MLLVNHRRSLTAVMAGTFAAAFAVACKDDSAGQASAAQTTAQAGTAARHRRPQSRVPGGPGGMGRGGGRAASAITLAATDVAVVKRETIEAGIPITGDLHPIETIGVRAASRAISLASSCAKASALHRDSCSRSSSPASRKRRCRAPKPTWHRRNPIWRRRSGTSTRARICSKPARSPNAISRWRSRRWSRRKRVSPRPRHASSRRATARATHKRAGAGSRDHREATRAEWGTSHAGPAIVQSRAQRRAGAHRRPFRRNRRTAVKPGQVVHFVADARNFDGTVARVSPTIDPTTRAITVYVTVPNRDGALKGGTFAAGRVVQRTLTDAIVVPTPALRQSAENGQTFVYRVASRAVEAAQIQLGVIDERAGKSGGPVGTQRTVIG